MTQEQLDLTNQLFNAVYGVADSLGSEASDVAQLILTKNKTLASCKDYFPEGFTFEDLTEDAFKKTSRDADSLNNLLNLMTEGEKTFGVFRVDKNSWWLCVFWNSETKIGSNVLIRANRVET
ncbi:MAG: hypothetical protein H7Z37_03325 [Pyrinomonadaceae bacterium]|nr:hypothetical protein [Pyrinomonadaceae bacterium]